MRCNESMNLPSVPFDIRVEHDQATTLASCMSMEPADHISAGAWRLLLAMRRVIGMLPGEDIWLIWRGDRRKATLVDVTNTLRGSNFVTLILSIPEDWFSPQLIFNFQANDRNA